MFITAAKYVTAGLPGLVLVTATSDGLGWLDGITPLQGLGSGAVIVTLGFVLYRVILKAFDRADEIQRGIIDELRAENARLIASLTRTEDVLTTERNLRMSLEQAGIVDRRKQPPV